jgi:hypothetical protein
LGNLFSIIVGLSLFLAIFSFTLYLAGGLLIFGLLIAGIGNYFADDIEGEKWRVWLAIVLLSTSLGPLTTPLFCPLQFESVSLSRYSTPKEFFETGDTVQERWVRGTLRNTACYDRGGLVWSLENQPYRFMLRIVLLGYSIFLLYQFLAIRRSPRAANAEKKIQTSNLKKIKKKPTPGIGNTGREVILLRNGDASTNEERFDFYYENMLDIITREHLSKGDLDTWFARTAIAYIDAYPQFSQNYEPQDLVTALNWALGHVATMYTGSSVATGEKRAATLKGLITQLKNL